MFRISDILKKKIEDEKTRRADVPVKTPPTAPLETPAQRLEPVTPIAKILPVAAQESAQPGLSATDVYTEAIELVKRVFEKGKNNLPIEGKEIVKFVDRLVENLSAQEEAFLRLVQVPIIDEYILFHPVNVCILSVMIGFSLSYDRTRLKELGICALLNDIGMIKVAPLANLNRKLDTSELEEIKRHVLYGVEILGKSKDIDKVVIYVTSQVHERADGKGYPKGLSNGEIDEYARIIAVIDTYDALIRPRPYRKSLLPHEAMQEILKNKESFDQSFLKHLVERIGIYPIGSFVEINTGEIGQVSKANKGSPLRPVLEIRFDSGGNQLKHLKTLDLSQHPTIYIRKPLKEEELKERVKELK